MPTPSITIKADLDSASATFGKYVLTDTTDWVAEGYVLANITGYFVVTDPLGLYRTGSFGTPDTDGSIPDMVFNTLALRQNSDLGYLLGDYNVTYYAEDSASSDVFSVSVDFTIEAQGDVLGTDGVIGTGVVEHTINPFTLVLTITDETDWGDPTTDSRTMYLDPPEFTGLPQVTNAGPTLTYTFSYVNVAYSLEVDSLLTYVSGAFTLAVRAIYLEAITVQVPQSVAALYKCFNRFYAYVVAQAVPYGGIQNIKGSIRDDFFFVIATIMDMEMSAKISNFTQMETDIALAQATMVKYVPCDCACDTTQPTLADPYAGSGATSYTFAATYPVTVSVVGTTVTYALDAAFLASITGLLTDVIQSTDTSVVVTSSVTGTTKTWNLAQKNSMGLTALLEYTAGNNISVTISNEYRQGTRYVDVTGAWKTNNNIQVEGYPFASVAALEAAPAVFFIKDFLTTPGTTPTDKIDLDSVQILNAGASATDYTQSKKFVLSMIGLTTDKIRFQLFDAISGLPVSMYRFVNEIASMTITLKINQ